MKTLAALSFPRVALGAVLGAGLAVLGSCASTDPEVGLDDVTNQTTLSFHELRTPTEDEVSALQTWFESDAGSEAVREGAAQVPVSGFVLARVENASEDLQPSLVEFGDLTFVAVEPASFTQDDMDPSRCEVSLDDRGVPALRYTMREERRAAYSDWSDSLIGRHTAVVVGDEAVALPYFVARISESGMLAGSFEEAELQAILAAIQSGE